MSLNDLTLGVIGGGGWLGKAIVQSALDAGCIAPERLILSSRNPRPGLFPGAVWTSDNQSLADRADIVIVSVRPGDFAQIGAIMPDKLAISVMAGVDFATISAQLGTSRVIRCLPNAAAEVASSYTPWAATEQCTTADRDAARLIFAACGTADELPDERQVDYLSVISGGGPAFPALLADALRRNAVAQGISDHVARNAVNGLLIGTGRMTAVQGRCPSDVVAEFVAYRGMLTAALECMQEAGFDRIVDAGVAAAMRKGGILPDS